MSSLRPRGVTLTELLVALTLCGVVAAAVGELLARTRNFARRSGGEIDVDQNLRVAAGLLPAELRELDAADGDIVAMGPAELTLRATRQLGVLCRPPLPAATPGVEDLTVRLPLLTALRDFNPARDSLWVFRDGDRASADDDAWIPAAIVSLAPDSCPDGEAARRVSVAPAATRAGASMTDGSVGGRAPVLGFETVTYRAYRSSADGRWYLGQETASDLQPVLGPLTAGGLQFAYRDSSGVETTLPPQVRVVEFRVRAAATESPEVDSLAGAVFLRNNPRH